MARLVILAGDDAGTILELQRGANTIGRAPDNDFIIDDPTISSHHCRIDASDFAIKIQDLGSTNGTFVDGVPLKDAKVKDGQVIKFGSFTLRLEIPPVNISIPELPKPDMPPPLFTESGEPACAQHSDVVADFLCTQCGRTHCADCVSRLRLAGGKGRVFCPTCSGNCVSISLETRPARPPSLAARLMQTLRLPFRK